jgi:hypothetical protein
LDLLAESLLYKGGILLQSIIYGLENDSLHGFVQGGIVF